MTMPPGLRKFALTVHITASVGWIGAVMAYLGLVIAALTAPDEAQRVRAVCIAMELIAWYILAPLALAALLTGLIMSLGTKWGLFRHYWVLISLLLTLVAVFVLLTQLEQISLLAAEANSADTRPRLWGQLLHAGGGLLVLLVIQGLNVCKPRGLTPYGWRKQYQQRTTSPSAAT